MSRTERAVATPGSAPYSAAPRMDVPDSTSAPVADYAPKARLPEHPSPTAALAVDPASLLLSDWVLALADRHRHKLFIALIGIYLLGFNGQWRIEPDSALYLTVGRNLAEGRGYTYNGELHHLAFPGLPLLFAGIFRLFHTENLLPALIVMPLIGAATLALTYRLFLIHAGRPTAVLITFGLGISRLFYRYCFELLSDLPFLFGVMAFLVGYEAVFHSRPAEPGEKKSPFRARWFDWVLLFGGLGITIAMRPSMWALLIAIVLALAWSMVRGPVRWPPILIGLTVVAAAALFWRYDPRHGGSASMGEYEDGLFNVTFAHLGAMFQRMAGDYIPKLFEKTLSQALFGARLGPGFSELAGAAVVVVSATMLRNRPLWFLWVAMTFVIMLVAIEPLDRYFLEVLPLLVFAWWQGIRWLNLRLAGLKAARLRVSQEWANRIFIGLFILGGTTNLMRTGEFIVEQRRRPFLSLYKDGRYASQKQVARLLREHVGEGEWVLASPRFARILTFFSRRNVVGPLAQVPLDPGAGNVYVLEPLDDDARRKLDQLQAGIGPPVGPAVQGKFDPEPWQLRRARPQ